MYIWCRYTGEPAVGDFPPSRGCTFKNFRDDREILEYIGTHCITHMWIREGVLPSLELVAPKLIALKVEGNVKVTVHPKPRSWSSLKNLEHLDIQGTCFTDGLLKDIAALPSLKNLDLYDCNLQSLPECLSSLKQLKNLQLSGNNFSSGLPAVIGKLPSLEKLMLWKCQLTNLPTWMTSLKNLKDIILSENNFSAGLPEVVGELSSLEQLWLSDCQLTDLPMSLSSLINLKGLVITNNKFPLSVPEVISKLISLEQLRLNHCELTSLPASFGKLMNLENLSLNGNKFKHFPKAICQLKNLRELSLSSNARLRSLDPEILHLTKLEQLHCPENLQSPPSNVCKQGLRAIRQYCRDLIRKGEGHNLPAATVSVIGKSKAGKTSLIRTLQQNARVLTGSVGTGEDVSTKVFNFEEVEVENTKLRFIDFGGQEIYHLAYGLTLRENCVPVIVVNMEMYKETSAKIGDREAVRRLYFDWMAHLYLSQPDLPAPKLVITHEDKFSSKEFKEVKDRFLANSNSVRDSIVLEESQLFRKDFRRITHLAQSKELFDSKNIFVIGRQNDSQTFDALKHQLLESCKCYIMKVPRIWEEIEENICSLSSPFSTLDGLLSKLDASLSVDKEQLEIILTYMHSCGKLLWYKEDQRLRSYVFHKITAIIQLLNVLLDHDDAAKWVKRHEQFVPCQIQCNDLHIVRYENFVERFKETGIISRMLLAYLIHLESEFMSDAELSIALELLTTFRLAFGPITCDNEPSYIVPHFSVGYFSNLQNDNSSVALHADILLKSYSLPEYVYHEMTVGLLGLFPSQMDDLCVLHNGAKVEVNNVMVRLSHDRKARKATVLVSSAVKDIGKSWAQLIRVVNKTIEHLLHTWKAAQFECVFHCAHCKLNGFQHPRKIINPSWIGYSNVKGVATDGEMRVVKCGEEKVFSAFRFPCTSLSRAAKQKLEDYVASVKSKRPTPKKYLPQAAKEPQSGHSSQSTDTLHTLAARLMKSGFRIVPTQEDKIKKLYSDIDQVYMMTSPRGMALVINNMEFSPMSELPIRAGSAIDLRNVQGMLDDLDFEVDIKINLTAREMLTAIESTVTQQSEMVDHGMFVLVLMSHGGENDLVFGTDGNPIDLHDVYGLLSSHNFPTMTKKPKLVIVQACSGALGDYGPLGRKEVASVGIMGMAQRPKSSSVGFGDTVQPLIGTKIDHLNTDDLIVIKASFNTYASMRHDQHGCPFITYLVYNFSKYACHTDVETLCKMIQHDVRVESMRLANEYPKKCFGQAPFFFSMLTDLRRLYLFPGYNGE